MSVLSPRRATPELSLIVPAYNEAILLDSTIRRLHAVVAGLKVTYEIIIVDDGSSVLGRARWSAQHRLARVP
jgi:cellulose synthase/poly-beta-1,6-N-acetylglucosamine synthase-like glycosyltransferase